ncbi:MAG: hypothetical protein MJZ41_11675 [Bacteroidaceae bacterium]|nr:hypothetical protein [Bacteroidaceae bacterium]
MKSKLDRYVKEFPDEDILGLELAKLCHQSDGFYDLLTSVVDTDYSHSMEGMMEELNFIAEKSEEEIVDNFMSEDDNAYIPLPHFESAYELVESFLTILGHSCAEYVDDSNYEELKLDPFTSGLVTGLLESM